MEKEKKRRKTIKGDERASNVFDVVLQAAFMAAESHGISRRDFAATLRKCSNFVVMDRQFRDQAARAETVRRALESMEDFRL